MGSEWWEAGYSGTLVSVAHHARDLGRLFLLWASAFQGGLFLAGGGIEGSGKTFSESVAQQGCTKCCPPLTQWVLLPCVEELGETVRAGLKQGTETVSTDAEDPEGACRGWAGLGERVVSGQHLPIRGSDSGGSQGEVEVQWKCQAAKG